MNAQPTIEPICRVPCGGVSSDTMAQLGPSRPSHRVVPCQSLASGNPAMLRILVLLMLAGMLAVSIAAILANSDPERLKAAGWGLLAGALIVGGLWMILAGG